MKGKDKLPTGTTAALHAQTRKALVGGVRELSVLCSYVCEQNGDGRVDHRELVIGLTMLCGGDPETKARAAFKLLDEDGDGSLSLEELTAYVETVLRSEQNRVLWCVLLCCVAQCSCVP